MQTRRLALLVGLIVLAALSRLIPHPPNFAPIAAIALFGGAVFADRRLAYAVPAVAMLLSDLLLGFHDQMLLVYACIAAVVWLGTRLGYQRGALPVLAATLGGSVLFFVVTNLGVWAFDGLYPLTAGGLVACYVAAIPFFHNSLAANLLYAGLLFGGLALMQRRYTWLRGVVGTA